MTRHIKAWMRSNLRRPIMVNANVLAEGPNPLPDLWRTFTLVFLLRLGALDEQLHEHL